MCISDLNISDVSFRATTRSFAARFFAGQLADYPRFQVKHTLDESGDGLRIFFKRV